MRSIRRTHPETFQNGNRDMADEKGGKTQAGANEPLTEVQSDVEVASSAEMSIPSHVRQHEKAPKISGYVLRELLGEGAYGQVWRSWQVRANKEVAIKIFLRKSGLDWILLQREVERLARLDRHPNIVTLLDVDLDRDPPYYVMDLLSGGPLQQFVDPAAPAPAKKALRWVGQICDALTYVHAKGLIHCDLKPANILVDGRENIRVLDFGQSRVFTESAASLGTLFYMAPEQAILSEPGNPVQPDVRWDVYAVGGTLYAILTGSVPHGDPRNKARLEEAPALAERLARYREIVALEPLQWTNGSTSGSIHRELAAIADKCLSPDPDRRYDTVSSLAEDLRALEENRPISPLASKPGYRFRKFVGRNPLKIGLAVAAVLLVSTLFVVWRMAIRANEAEAERIISSMVVDPAGGIEQIRGANSDIQHILTRLSTDYMSSPAYTLRIMGARSAPLVAPDEFWGAVDTGALWENGEWLEIARWPESEKPVALLKSKAENGTGRQKYAAFCLLGQLQAGGDAIVELCGDTVKSETNPGVVSAAKWTAGRLGRDVPYVKNENVFIDETSGMVFARIPGDEAFRPGSPPNEIGRLKDEDPPAETSRVGPLWMSVTEVTLSQFERFLRSPQGPSAIEPLSSQAVEKELSDTDAKFHETTAVHSVTPKTAFQFCEWLSDAAFEKRPGRSYRLPTEYEWEYACRGGNKGAFCFGDSVSYADYFTADYSDNRPFAVATRMPNWYGLFDMHGNLWEICGTVYRERYDDPEPTDARANVVQRGGGAYNKARACRSAQRNYIGPRVASDRAGFRIVMELESPG